MSYRCEVCSQVVPPKMSQRRHIISRVVPTQKIVSGCCVYNERLEIEQEIPVCADCDASLQKGVSLSYLRELAAVQQRAADEALHTVVSATVDKRRKEDNRNATQVVIIEEDVDYRPAVFDVSDESDALQFTTPVVAKPKTKRRRAK